jgi:hypothetical protein
VLKGKEFEKDNNMQVSSSTNAIGICAQNLAVIRVILGC